MDRSANLHRLRGLNGSRQEMTVLFAARGEIYMACKNEVGWVKKKPPASGLQVDRPLNKRLA